MSNLGNAIREYLELIGGEAAFKSSSAMYSVLLPYKYIGMSHNVGIYQLAILRRAGFNTNIVYMFRKAYSTTTGLIKPNENKSWAYL